jgi:hypothetical protein
VKLLLLLLCFLGACSTAQVNRVVQNNVPAPPPELTPDEILSREIDRAAELAGLARLKTANLGPYDTEIRAWYGFGLIALEGFVIKRTNNQWSAFHLKADHHSMRYAKQVSGIQLPAPKSGWESCWQRLVDAGVLTLPNGTEGRQIPMPKGSTLKPRTLVHTEITNIIRPNTLNRQTRNGCWLSATLFLTNSDWYGSM